MAGDAGNNRGMAIIRPSELFRARRHPHPVNGHQPRITDDRGLRTRHGGVRLLAPLLVARVQNQPVSLLNEELRGPSAEPVGRTCNEHPRHDFSTLFSKDAAKALHDRGTRSGAGIYPGQISTPPFSSNVALSNLSADGYSAAFRSCRI